MGIDQASSIDRSLLGARDVAHLWRDPRFGDLECLSARFRKHVYAPHTHDTYVIGIITEAAESFRYRGVKHIAEAGQVLALNPDELHDGQPVDETYAYRMMYPSPEILTREMEDLAGKPMPSTYFPAAIIDDAPLAKQMLTLHRVLETGGDRLEAESAFLAAMTQLALCHGEERPQVRRVGNESAPIRRVREYLDSCFSANVDLGTLAAMAGLSRFHLIRAFRKELSTTPHAYLTDRRITHARKLLHAGESLSETALLCGFYDQSHFSRTFKKRVGVSPGVYRSNQRGGSNFVQDL